MMRSSKTLVEFFCEILKPYKWYMAGILLSGLVLAIHSTLAPYLIKMIIDAIAEDHVDKANIFSLIKWPVIGYLAASVGIALNYRISDFLKLKMFPAIRKDTILMMFSYLNKHSYQYFQDRFTGALANKISDMNSGMVAVLTKLDEKFCQICTILIATTAIFFVHPMFTFILIGWSTVFVLIAVYFSKNIYRLSNIFSHSKSILIGKIVDNVSNIVNVHLFGRNAFENERILDAVKETSKRDRTTQVYILKMRVFLDIVTVAFLSSMMVGLVYMYKRGQVTVGDFSFIMTVSISIFDSIFWFVSQLAPFSEDLGKCNQAISIINRPHDIVDKPNARALKVTQGRIEFQNVHFSYSGMQEVFNNKNVIINPREKVGLVGLSGSGKSTFINLIMRFFDPQKGAILIDGQNIKNITVDSLRTNISMIPQDTSLFHRTIFENIKYGRLDATYDEVINASKQSHCHEFIMAMPNGYNTIVGERGTKLSGGQKQRIAIARALLKTAPILILDEATSSLDSITERQIRDSIALLTKSKTTLVIAHRLSTLVDLDRILVFDRGRIVEDGKHSDLLKARGYYAKLWKLQEGGFLPESMIA